MWCVGYAADAAHPVSYTHLDVYKRQLLGYFLGGIPFLQKNIEVALVAIGLVSVLPGVFEGSRHPLQAGRRQP